MKQGTIFTNAAFAAVLATSMATAPALAGPAHTPGANSAGVAYAAQATPIESVANTGDWTATDAENKAILDKAEAAKLVGLKPLKAYLSGETVAAADFLTIDVDALANIDADLAKLVKQTQKAIADSNAATEPEVKPETKPEPTTPSNPLKPRPRPPGQALRPKAPAKAPLRRSPPRTSKTPRGHGAGKRHP